MKIMKGHTIMVNSFCNSLSGNLNCRAWTAAMTWNASRAVAIQLAAQWILRQVRQVMPGRSAKKQKWLADRGKIRFTRASPPAWRSAPVNDFILKRTRKTITATYDAWRRTLALDHGPQSWCLGTTNGRAGKLEQKTSLIGKDGEGLDQEKPSKDTASGNSVNC